jgi:hypothetical protein
VPKVFVGGLAIARREFVGERLGAHTIDSRREIPFFILKK